MTYTPTLINYDNLTNPPTVAVIAYPGFPEGMFEVQDKDEEKLHAVERIRQVSCGIASWLGLPSPAEVPASRLWAVHRALITEGIAKNYETGEVCHACLRPALIGLEGKRVEAINDQGDTIRFVVQRAAGWLPAHLAEHKRGGVQLAPAIRFVRVLKQGRN